MPLLNDLFDALVRARPDTLLGSTTRAADDTYTTTGTDASQRRLTMVYRYENTALKILSVSADLDRLTLKELHTSGLLPDSTYSTQGLPDVPFHELRASADAERRAVMIIGSGPDESVTLGVAALPLAETRLNLEWYVPASGPASNTAAEIGGVLKIGGGLFVTVTLPRGSADWQLNSLGSAQSRLSGLSELDPLTEISVAAIVPAPLLVPPPYPVLETFYLTHVHATFDSENRLIRAMGIEIGNMNPCVFVPDRLILERLLIWLNFTLAYDGGGQPAGLALSGRILCTISLFDVNVNALIPIPPISQKWVIEAYPQLELPGIGEIAQGLLNLIGAANFALALPEGMDALGSLLVEKLSIEFTPGTADVVLNRVAVRASSIRNWQLPYVPISIRDVLIDVSVSDPLGTKRQVTGILAGTLVVGGVFVPVSILRKESADEWTLRVDYDEIEVGLPDLLKLIDISPQEFRAALPSRLSVVSDLALTSLNIAYSLSRHKLTSFQFTASMRQTWTLIEGYLSVDKFDIAMDAQFHLEPDDSTQITTVIGLGVTIAGVGFVLTAANDSPDAQWILSAALREGDRLSLTTLTTELVRAKVLSHSPNLPSTFPTVEVTAASVAVTPDTGAFKAGLTFSIGWSIPFAHATFRIDDLTAALKIGEIPKPPAPAVRPYDFTARGKFSFLGISGAAAFTTTNTGGDTIIAAALSNSSTAVKLPSVARQLTTGTESAADTWSALLPEMPAGLTDLGTLTLDAWINLTQKLFVLHGRSSNYAAVTFLTKEVAANNWGFFVAARLEPGFRFASILPALSVIDGALKFSHGCFAYSSFNAESTQAIAATVPALSNWRALYSATPVPVRPGLNVFARLDFSYPELGTLSGNVATVLRGLDDLDDNPGLILYGNISKNASDPTSLKARFQATLGTFYPLPSRLDAANLRFSGVTLHYSYDRHSEVALRGEMELILNAETREEQVYPFHGELKVTPARADFALTTLPSRSMINPLGMTGVTVEDLRFAFSQTFQAPQTTTLGLSGKARFGSSARFDSILSFVGAEPVLVSVSLAHDPPLGIIGLIASSISGVAYPADYFDIHFISGSAYYYKQSADPERNYAYLELSPHQQVARSNGFNLQTSLKLFDQTVSLAANIQSGRLTASGKMVNPFDLGFIKFLDADFTGSPSLFLNLSTSEKAFGLRAGFEFFGEPFAASEFSVRKSGSGDAELNGRLAYAGNIEMFLGSVLEFRYSKTSGFQITNWPLDISKGVDYVKQMNHFAKAGCPELVDMVFEKTVKTNFSVQPRFSSDASHYTITLKGTYSVALFSEAYPFLYVSLPDLPILIDRTQPFSLRKLPDKIKQTIDDSVGRIVANILNDPAKFTAFVATVGLKNAAPSLLTNLICNGGKDGQENPQVSSQANSAARTATSASAASQAATTAAAAGVAAGSAAGAAATALGAAAGVGGGLLAAASAVTAAVSARAAAAAYANHSYQAAKASKPEESPQLSKPTIADFSFDGAQLVVAWQQVPGCTAFLIELLRGGNVVALDYVPPATLRTTFLTTNLQPGDYAVQVRANATNYQESISDRASIVLLPAPATVSVSYNQQANQIDVSWASVSSGGGYSVVLVKDGQPYGNAEPVTPATATSKSFGMAGLPGGNYGARVATTSPNANTIPSPWAGSTSATLKLSAPTITGLEYTDGTVFANFQAAVDHATNYDAQFVDASSGPVGRINPSAASTPPRASVPAAIALGQYRVRVRATGAASVIPSDWVASITSVTILPVPTITSLTYGGNSVAVTCTWPAGGAIAGYTIQLQNPNNSVAASQTVTLTPAGTSPPTAFSLDVTTVARGIMYRGFLQAVGADHSSGHWSHVVAVFIADPPGHLTITYADGSVTAHWDAVPEATNYYFALLDANNNSVARQASPLRDPSVTTVKTALGPHVPRGVVYRGYVQATFSSMSGPRSALASVMVLDPPPGLSVTLKNGQVIATWSAAKGATGYHFELRDPRGTSVATASGPNTTHALTTSNLQPDYTYTGYVKSTAGAGESAWSSGVAMVIYVPSLPVYRYGQNGFHLYTSNPAAENLNGWTSEGIHFYAYRTAARGLSPVYRFVAAGGVARKYSLQENAEPGWTSEGIAWYVFTWGAPQPKGTAQLSVYQSTSAPTTFFYTADPRRSALEAAGYKGHPPLGFVYVWEGKNSAALPEAGSTNTVWDDSWVFGSLGADIVFDFQHDITQPFQIMVVLAPSKPATSPADYVAPVYAVALSNQAAWIGKSPDLATQLAFATSLPAAETTSIWISYRDPGYITMGLGRSVRQNVQVTYTDPTPVAGIRYFGFAQPGSSANGKITNILVTSQFGVDLGESQLVQAARVPITGFSYGLDVSGKYAVIADISAGITVCDISDLAHPRKLASAAPIAHQVTVSGNRAYAATQGMFYVLDLSLLPASPTILGSCRTVRTIGTPGKIAVAGNFAYVPDDTEGLRIIDVSNASSPFVAATVPCTRIHDGFSGVFIRSPYAYVASNLYGMSVYHMTNPTTLALTGSYNKPITYIQARAITVAGNYAYLASSAGSGAIYVISVAPTCLLSAISPTPSAKVSDCSPWTYPIPRTRFPSP
jgi:hypothetical protein